MMMMHDDDDDDDDEHDGEDDPAKMIDEKDCIDAPARLQDNTVLDIRADCVPLRNVPKNPSCPRPHMLPSSK